MSFETEIDLARQAEIANILASAWACEWSPMGSYSPLDVYLMRNKTIVGVAEIKNRLNRTLNQQPVVYMDLHKWDALMRAEIGLGVAGLYVAGMEDGIFYVRVGMMPAREFKLTARGRTDRVGWNGIRPVIEVPNEWFRKIDTVDDWVKSYCAEETRRFDEGVSDETQVET